MITLSEAFKKFKSRLELTDGEQRDASRRHTNVRELLRVEFDIERDFLTGSYGRHTKTKPLKDIDIFFVLGKNGSEYRDKSPGTVLSDFKKVLDAEYGYQNVELGRRSVQVNFGIKPIDDKTNDLVMSVDVVPAIAAGNNYEIPDTHLNSWIKTNPEIHAEKATTANKDFSGEWKPLVKMLKKWNSVNDKPIKPSFLIEVMALQVFVPPFSGGYKYEIKSFLATAADRIGETWEDPANLGPPVSDQMDHYQINIARQKLREAGETIDQAINLERQGKNGESLKKWRELFGPLFPLS
jgi:hypothetical protein